MAGQEEMLRPEQHPSVRWMPWVLAAIAVFVLSFQLGARELSAPDETRYVSIAWSMRETGDWLTPTHNFKFKHWHKPPLTYWLMASSFAALGENDWAARVPSAVAALAVVMGVYVIGRTIHGPTTGFVSGLILLASPLFFALARLANADMLLCAFITWTWVCFARSLFGERRRALWFVLGGVFAGLGFMTKGPVVLLGTLAPMVLYTLLTNRWRRIGWWPWLAATGAFLVVGLPWYIIVCLKNPGLFTYFIEYQTLQRVTTEVHERVAPFYFFFVVVFFGLFPWSVFAVSWLSSPARGDEGRGSERRWSALLPVVWFGVVFVFITVSKSKLATYCLPLLPAMALGCGRVVARGLERRLFRPFDAWDYALAAISLLAAGVVLAVTAGASATHGSLSSLWAWTCALGVLVSLLAAGCLVALMLRRFAVCTGLFVVLMLAVLLVGSWLVVGHEDQIGIGNAGDELAALIRARRETIAYDKGVTPVMYRRYVKELPYYVGHPVLCLDCDVEFDYERPNGTTVSFYTEAELRALEKGYYRWNGRERLYHMMRLMGRRLLVVTDRESYEDISSDFVYHGEPLVHLIAEVGEFVLCSNHPDTPTKRSGADPSSPNED